MVAILIAVLLIVFPTTPGSFNLASSMTVQVEANSPQEPCDHNKTYGTPTQCCAVACQLFVSEVPASTIPYVPASAPVTYPLPSRHLTGIIPSPSLGPPRQSA